MKLFLIVLSVLGLSTNPITTDINKGLIAYYSFNDCKANNEVDESGDGILYGDIDCWCGVEGNALLLDGQDDFIEFPGNLNKAFNIQDFTISFYIKTEAYSIFPSSLFSKREQCDLLQMIDIQFNPRNLQFPTYFHESETRFFKDLSPTSDSSEWVHYALIRDGFTAQTYINGTLRHESFKCRGVDISNEAIFSFSNSPCIQNGRTQRFKGLLDELRIYDRALTESEMAELYALHPVDRANPDCLSALEKNKPFMPVNEESFYLCRTN